MQIGLSYLVGGFLAILLLVGGAFTVGTKWAESGTNTASVGEAVDYEEDKATSTDETIEESEVKEDLVEVVAKKFKELMETSIPKEKLKNVPIIAEAHTGDNWGEMQKI